MMGFYQNTRLLAAGVLTCAGLAGVAVAQPQTQPQTLPASHSISAPPVPQAAPPQAPSVDELRARAANGDAASQVQLGKLYAQDKTPTSTQAAFNLFQSAAEKGDAEAIFEMGRAYYIGRGTDQDYTKSLGWFEKLAMRGNADAQYMVSIMYAEGVGTEVNETEAAKWLRQSAVQGNAPARVMLADFYAEGTGVEKDPVRAIGLYNLAASRTTGQIHDLAVSRAQMVQASLTTVGLAAGTANVEAPLEAMPYAEALNSNIPVAGEELIGAMQTPAEAPFTDIKPEGGHSSAYIKIIYVKFPEGVTPPNIDSLMIKVATVDGYYLGQFSVLVPQNRVVAGGSVAVKIKGQHLNILKEYTTDTALITAYGLLNKKLINPNKPYMTALLANSDAPLQLYMNNDGAVIRVAAKAQSVEECRDAGEGPYTLFRRVCEVNKPFKEIKLIRPRAAVMPLDY
jgi:hypothetical protein